MQPSLDWLTNYLENTNPYDEIYVTRFSHGVDAVGLPSIEEWQSILKFAQKHDDFIGVETDKFPRNFSTLVRNYTDLKRNIHARYLLPRSLSIEQLNQFIEKEGDRFPVEWID